MAEKLQANLGATVELIPGSNGIFDVKVEETMVYSKAATGVFPEEDSLVQELVAKYK